ncbi:hypothetical protein DYB32_004434 [Aphanomyces invadans]|uniref:Uncharacterized protein n=1 Tax=Aphanomyces invadans TaxID=157072 RepID=A0A3R7D191_9STRA|nr:hypothetical protein DYB32_004434 [Aphanomyces invadans]
MDAAAPMLLKALPSILLNCIYGDESNEIVRAATRQCFRQTRLSLAMEFFKAASQIAAPPLDKDDSERLQPQQVEVICQADVGLQWVITALQSFRAEEGASARVEALPSHSGKELAIVSLYLHPRVSPEVAAEIARLAPVRFTKNSPLGDLLVKSGLYRKLTRALCFDGQVELATSLFAWLQDIQNAVVPLDIWTLFFGKARRLITDISDETNHRQRLQSALHQFINQLARHAYAGEDVDEAVVAAMKAALHVGDVASAVQLQNTSSWVPKDGTQDALATVLAGINGIHMGLGTYRKMLLQVIHDLDMVTAHAMLQHAQNHSIEVSPDVFTVCFAQHAHSKRDPAAFVSLLNSMSTLGLLQDNGVVYQERLGTFVTHRVDVTGNVSGTTNLTLACNASLHLFENGMPFGRFVRSLVQLRQIWNPSAIAMDVGDVQLRLAVSTKSVLGFVATHMTLEPQSTSRVHLDGRGLPHSYHVLYLHPDVNAFFSRYISNEPSLLEIAITSINTTIPWVQQSLARTQVQTVFPGVAVDLISHLAMPEMHIHFNATAMIMHARMQARVALPSALAHLPINITHLELSSQLVSNHNVLSHVVIPFQAVEYSPTGFGTGSVAFESDISLHAIDVYDIAFTCGYMRHAMERADGVSPVVKTPMGRLALSNLPVNATLMLVGMDGLQLDGVNVTSVDIVSGTSDSLVLSMALTLWNPSQVTAILDSLSVQVWLNESLLGEAALANVSLACCHVMSALTGLFSFHPTNMTAGRAFLSRFVSGKAAQELTSAVPSLSQFFPHMPTLVSLSKMYKPSIWDLFTVATALKVRNPFGHAINVTATNLQLFPCATQHKDASGRLICSKYYDVPLARFNPKEFIAMVIPAATTPEGCFTCCQGAKCWEAMPLCPGATVGSCMKAKVDMSLWSFEMIKTLYATMTTGLLMHVEGTLTAMIDAYPMELDYVQDELLVVMA